MSSTTGRRHAAREKSLTVYLLNKSKLVIPVDNKTRYGDILIKLRKHLQLSSSNVFGLAHKTEHGDYHFLDPMCKVWKTEKAVSQFGESGVIPHVYLRVQYYVESGHKFRSDSDRQYYFLQLKENFLRYGFNQPDDRCFLLASYAIHSDSVMWKTFDPREYFPAWVLKRYGTQFMRKHMPTIRPDKISPHQALTTYINELSSPIPYVYNMRLYRAQSCKHKNTNNFRVGITPDGLEIYEVNSSGYLSYLSSYHWASIQEINAMKRKLSVLVNGRRLEFYTHSDEWCRVLSETIQSARLVYSGSQTTLVLPQELLDLDGMAFRESYIYSDEQDLEWECEKSLQGTLPSSSKCASSTPVSGPVSPHFTSPPLSTSTSNSDMVISPPSRCRFSIISNTSSTTTSGIVSDRTCFSTDNSQEDLISSATRPSSCDSLLNSTDELRTYYPDTRLVTVQRAISAPSKKFEQLKLQVSQQKSTKCLPRRALSDETIDEHDYENVAIIQQVLGIKTTQSKNKKKPNQLLISRSSDKLSSSNTSMQSVSSQIQGYSRKFSIGSSHHSSSSSPVASHRYSLLSQSPSMEQLLLDYTPPPSYSEAHARQGQIILSTSRQVSQDSNCSSASNLLQHGGTPVKRNTSAVKLTPPAQQKREVYKQKGTSPEQQRSQQPRSQQPRSLYYSQDGIDERRKPSAPSKATNNNVKKCTCMELSHPEIDRLRNEVEQELSTLPPMIAALCSDKQLLQSANQCTCNKAPNSPRPISWHCETGPVFSFPGGNELSTAQACH